MMTIKIHTPFIRLDQALQFASLTQSGGESKLLIQDGEVMVNGEIETQRGKKLYPGDVITFDDQRFVIAEDE